MRRTCVFFAAAISVSTILLLEKPCLAQDAQSYAISKDDSRAAGAPQAAPALSPGHSLYWSKTHLPVGVEDTEAQRALALAERKIEDNQRRNCSLIFLAGVIDMADNTPTYDNNYSFASPCQ